MLKPRPTDRHPRAPRILPLLLAAAAILLVLGGFAAWRGHRAGLEARLLSTPPDRLEAHADLKAFAVQLAQPIFARECAGCHGADMKGAAAIGAPDLTDAHWLYRDDVFNTERVILYGVRSGDPRAKNVTDMPAFGLKGQLDSADIENVVQYVLQLSGRPHDASAAELGKTVYENEAACFDCHTRPGTGNPDYGAPDLTANAWAYGGTPKALYDSVYFGRHGVMPAWRGKLSLAQIRALAVYVHSASHS